MNITTKQISLKKQINSYNNNTEIKTKKKCKDVHDMCMCLWSNLNKQQGIQKLQSSSFFKHCLKHFKEQLFAKMKIYSKA